MERRELSASPVDRAAVERARGMSDEEKLLAGPALFDYACEITLAGIRLEHPGADDAAVEAILRQRLDLARRLGI